jgi:hypothetical protein
VVANEKNDDRYEPTGQTEHAADDSEPVLDSPEVWWRRWYRRRLASAGRELDLLGVPSLLSVAHQDISNHSRRDDHYGHSYKEECEPK